MNRIILADDHSFIRLGLIQILKDEYPLADITEVGDGESLVKEVTLHDFDLVITDIDMPGRSGLEALQQIKLIKPDLPVLVLSIYPEEIYAVRVLKAGASGYMNKNAAPEELINAIRRISLGRKYITPEIAERLLTHIDSDKNPHELLTNRELEIFRLLALGKTITQISASLSLAPTTVSTYRTRILAKIRIKSNAELVRYALEKKLI
jgi:two-component system, NarL family, invasion response regulator UvrY